MKSSTDIFIIGLAFADLLACLFTPLSINHWLYKENHDNLILCRFSVGSMFWTVFNSLLLTTVIAFDRYDAVARPYGRICTPRNAKYVVIVCYILALIFSIPIFFSYGIIGPRGTTSPGGCTWLETTQIRVNFSRFGLLPLTNIICFFAVVGLYLKIYLKIRRQVKVHTISVFTINTDNEIAENRPGRDNCEDLQQERHSSEPGDIDEGAGTNQGISINPNGSEPGQLRNNLHACSSKATSDASSARSAVFDRQLANAAANLQAAAAATGSEQRSVLQKRTTKMLFFTTIVFFVTWFPANLITHAQTNLSYKTSEPGLHAMFNLVCFLFYVNNAVNPFIYGFVNKRFRSDCKKLLRSWECQCRT